MKGSTRYIDLYIDPFVSCNIQAMSAISVASKVGEGRPDAVRGNEPRRVSKVIAAPRNLSVRRVSAE